jgi:hypothetical protein
MRVHSQIKSLNGESVDPRRINAIFVESLIELKMQNSTRRCVKKD